MAYEIFGKKMGMTQVVDEGNVIPVTVIETQPSTVIEVKSVEKHGYTAVKLATNESSKKLKKPVKGILSKAGINKDFHTIREFRIDSADAGNYQNGQELTLDSAESWVFVDVTGTSKGKGFQGVIKRYGFKGGRATHGSHFHRIPGSIGQCADPSKVFKNVKMPGHMGNKKSTMQSLKVMKIDKDNGLILVKGAVPGPTGGQVIVKKAVKKA